MFVVVSLIFLASFSSVKCDNTTLPSSTEPTATTEQMDKIAKQFDIEQLSRQAKLVPMIRSFINSVGFLAKNLVVTYNWLHPELALGGCVMKYARAQYPELLQSTLTYDNIAKFVRSVYGMMFNYIREYMDENQQNAAIERERIGAKVAQITDYDTHTFMTSTPIYNNAADFYNYIQEYDTYQHHPQNQRQSREDDANVLSDSKNSYSNIESNRQLAAYIFNENHFLISSINKGNKSLPKKFHQMMPNLKRRHENLMPQLNEAYNERQKETIATVTQLPSTANIITKNVDNKYLDINSKDNSNIAQNHKKEKKIFSIMYAGPRKFPPAAVIPYNNNGVRADVAENGLTDKNSLTSFESSNLNTKTNSGKSDNLFDFENVILETFGVKTKGKSITLTTCTQKYVINILWRMIEGYFTG